MVLYPSRSNFLTFAISILKCADKIMYEFLLLLAVLVFFTLKYRETFVVKYGNPFNDEDIVSFDPGAKGTRLFGFTPDTCPANKPELDAGLCYEQCQDGYHGVGPVCWADTFGIGIGKIPELHFRMETHKSWGSIGCTGGRGFRFQGYDDCYNITIPVPYQLCPEYQDGDKRIRGDNVAGLCYKKCPEKLPNRVPGMPYLCFKGGNLSYGRGVGEVPPLWSFGE